MKSQFGINQRHGDKFTLAPGENLIKMFIGNYREWLQVAPASAGIDHFSVVCFFPIPQAYFDEQDTQQILASVTP